MKKLSVFAMCVVLIFCLTGCVNEEVTSLLDRRAAALAQYSSYEYESSTTWNVENETSDYIRTFSQEDYCSAIQLQGGGQIIHATYVNNRGTDIETSGEYDYYQRGDYGYYDVKGLGRYYEKSFQTNVNDFLGDYIDGLDASDFKSVTVTDVGGGGKKLRFVLDPSSVPEETANAYLMDHAGFMWNAFGDITHARLLGFEYVIVLDNNFLTQREQRNVIILFNLEDGSTAYATNEDILKFTKYHSIADDHLIFPEDLNEYMDHATYRAHLDSMEQ